MLFWTHSSLLSSTASVRVAISGLCYGQGQVPTFVLFGILAAFDNPCNFLLSHLSGTTASLSICLPFVLLCWLKNHPDLSHWSVLRLHQNTWPSFPPLCALSLLTLNSNCVSIPRFLLPALILQLRSWLICPVVTLTVLGQLTHIQNLTEWKWSSLPHCPSS